jgi:urea transporter
MKIALNNYFGSTGGLIAFVALAIVLGLALPWFVINSLNALFPVLAIPFTVETWAAVWVLNAFARFTISTSK